MGVAVAVFVYKQRHSREGETAAHTGAAREKSTHEDWRPSVDDSKKDECACRDGNFMSALSHPCPLRRVIADGDVSQVKELLRKGHKVTLTYVITIGNAPPKKRVEILSTLAECGMAVRGKDGEESLLSAVGYLEFQLDRDQYESMMNVVNWLLKQGVNVNAKFNGLRSDGFRDRTVLHISADTWSGSGLDTAVLEILVKAGAEINAKDAEGLTPLALVVRPNINRSGWHPAEEWIKLGADPNARSKSGRTVLMEALSGLYVNDNAVETLLKHGAEVNATDSDGATPLIYVAKSGMGEDRMIFLVKHGADPGIRDKTGKTALEWIRWSVPAELRDFPYWYSQYLREETFKLLGGKPPK